MFQKVYGHGERGLEPRQAVEDALELLHEDYAYEFQIGWSLWEAEIPTGSAKSSIPLDSPEATVQRTLDTPWKRAGRGSRGWCA